MSKTIEFVHESWWLCNHFVYGRGSVLEDQEGRQLEHPYDTQEAAVKDNPGVPVSGSYFERPRIPTYESVDKEACGERWDED